MALIVALLPACANPSPTLGDDTPRAPGSNPAAQAAEAILPLQLELPERYESWRPILMQEWASLQARFDVVAARWPREPQPDLPLRLVVPADAAQAQRFYATAGLQGAAQVPRTFPDLGLAVVPLPRDDRLISELPEPPRTWMHGFRHECAHLLSLDRPGLRAAPRWFQEGFAELWCADDAGASGRLMPLPDAWPRWGSYALYWEASSTQPFDGTASDLPAEVAYSAFAARVVASLQDASDTMPWESAPAAVPGRLAEPPPFLGLRGRHADWNDAQTSFLLASLPSQQVDLDLPLTLSIGETLNLRLQLGRSSAAPEGNLVLFGSEATGNTPQTSFQANRLRLRYGLGGGLAAYPESGQQSSYQALEVPNDRNRLGRERVVQLHLEADRLEVVSETYRRTFQLSELSLRPPLHLRMVVVDGAFSLQKR